MPQVSLFRRRWHTATDALPLMMMLLCLFHVLWFVPYATGAWSIEGTGLRHECTHAPELRAANYSLFALFGLAAINESVLTVVGLRGGPFETKKRKSMIPLLYLEVVLWVLLLAFTIYATVIVYSPEVSDACWSNNPCQYQPDIFPLACRDKSGKVIRELPPACQVLVNVGPSFFNCFSDWLVYGANWASDTVNVWDTFLTDMESHSVGPNGTDMEVDKGRLVLEWLVCIVISTGGEEAVDNIYASIGDVTADAADMEWLQDFIDDPNRNCTSVLEQFQTVANFTACNATIDTQYWNDTLGLELDVTSHSSDGAMFFTFPGVTTRQEYNAFLREHPNVFQFVSRAFMEAIGASELRQLRTGAVIAANFTEASDAPWFSCLDDTCQELTNYADDCTDWAQILSLPNPKNRKKFFEILVFTSWGVLGITGLVVYICFNAFPDYNDVDSWEGTVRSINRLCLCGGGLVGSANISGSDMSVSHEIAKSLNLLFGGVDMDSTDRLLGIYLVSERQHRRRQQDVLAALQKAGYSTNSGTRSKGGRVLHHLSKLASKSWHRGQQSNGHRNADTSEPATVATRCGDLASPSANGGAGAAAESGHGKRHDREGLNAVPLANNAAAAAEKQAPWADGQAEQSGGPAAQVAACQLPPSPFAVPAAPQMHQLSKGLPPAAPDPRLVLYQHSTVRLASSSLSHVNNSSKLVQDLAAAEEGRTEVSEDMTAAYDAEPEQVLESPDQPAGTGSGPGIDWQNRKAGHDSNSNSWQNKAIRIAARYRPLLTPSGCAASSLPLCPPLSPQAAADIYAGKLDAVDQGTLREARRISRFAVAAYGLQSVIWAQGRRPSRCLPTANRLAKCFRKPLGLEDKLRKRNFDAIVRITGIEPADFLYVSYANVAGGVLPYLIVLHRPSKSVVLSVRGTASMEDLITDLLSNPVDVTDWVPEWVQEEAQRRKAAGIAGDASGDSLKAHIGIISSATAVLKDMEERGLLREMLLSKLLRTATLLGRDTQEVIAEFLETHKADVPQVPTRQAASHTAPAGHNPVAAAAAGEGLRALSSRLGSMAAGEADEAEQPGFKEAERRHISNLTSLKEEVEVNLPLERAQAILRSKLQLDGWKVVVTGHSLGAAVACMLGMQLRERFADLHCWAFSPPGASLSCELAQISRCYCTSIVVGKDIISRLSINTAKRVVDEMVVSLARCKRPKLKIMCDVVLGRRKRPETTPRTFCKFEEMAPEALQLVEQYYRASRLHMKSADTTEMYPPGKMIFLRSFKGRRRQQTVWDAVWIDAATLISEGVLVTPSMMAHHRLFMLAEAFESIFAGQVVSESAAQDEQGEEGVVHPV